MEKNKTGKYLKYAIGEIILVVIGILIALQLNNLNELRKQKFIEIDVLEGIRNDILKDTIDINNNTRGYEYMQKGDSIVLNHLINKKGKTKWLAKHMASTVNSDFIILLHNSHFEEAKLKGLSIISNKNLRAIISRLYEFDYKALKILDNSTESFNTNKFLTRELGQYFAMDSSGVTMSNSSYEKLLSNGSSLYYFKEGMDRNKFLLGTYKETLTNALKVLDSINIELIELKK